MRHYLPLAALALVGCTVQINNPDVAANTTTGAITASVSAAPSVAPTPTPQPSVSPSPSPTATPSSTPKPTPTPSQPDKAFLSFMQSWHDSLSALNDNQGLLPLGFNAESGAPFVDGGTVRFELPVIAGAEKYGPWTYEIFLMVQPKIGNGKSFGSPIESSDGKFSFMALPPGVYSGGVRPKPNKAKAGDFVLAAFPISTFFVAYPDFPNVDPRVAEDLIAEQQQQQAQ